MKKIESAQKSIESRPADQDPEGHWGQPKNGFQLSLRFKKMIFTNDEPVVATILMRNITNDEQTYFRPILIIVTKDGKLLKRKNAGGPIQIIVSPQASLYPQTQHRYQENLNQIYDLTKMGEYIFQAKSKQPQVASQSVSILITNLITNAAHSK